MVKKSEASDANNKERADRLADTIASAAADPDAFAEAVDFAVQDVGTEALPDLFAACVLIGAETRGQEPAVVAMRCYEVADAMMAKRAERHMARAVAIREAQRAEKSK